MPASSSLNILSLDVGERRIGLAFADTSVKLPVALPAADTDRFTAEYMQALVREKSIDAVVVGLPRNQSGEETAQTAWVRRFIDDLGELGVPCTFQDESLTSVLAEERLKASRRPYSKGDIDSMAACIILEDYLESGRA